MVFFTRPGNSMILRPLSDESSIIAEAVAKLPEDKYNTGSTSLDWFTRRIKNQRVKNRTVCRCSHSFKDRFSSPHRVRRPGGRAVAQSTAPLRSRKILVESQGNRRKMKCKVCRSIVNALRAIYRILYRYAFDPISALTVPLVRWFRRANRT